MRAILALVCVAIFVSGGQALAAGYNQTSGCVSNCEKNKRACLSQYTKEDMRSGRYVTPEGRRICYSAYNECKKNCSKGR